MNTTISLPSWLRALVLFNALGRAFTFTPSAFITNNRIQIEPKFGQTLQHASILDDKGEPESGNILILDHLNINHEKGRHDLLKSFYFDFLQCGVDPRKEENLLTGKKTLWANIGPHQFHLPEGKPQAQTLRGQITLAYPSLDLLRERYAACQDACEGSKFQLLEDKKDRLLFCDPWGNRFCILHDPQGIFADDRGQQPGPASDGTAMVDLTILVPAGTDLYGISRFYSHIFHAPTIKLDAEQCVISTSPAQQTLTFQISMSTDISHHDIVRDQDGISNFGPHISMYIADFAGAYRRADQLGLTYVNPRFKRRAYTLEEALDQCMFRILDVVDALHPDRGVLFKLEHEVRSVVKKDGSMYKSCPFDTIPDVCES